MKKRVVRLSISTLLLLISIIVVAMSNNEEDIRDESCAIETNQYVGALLEYQNTGDTYRCVISKREESVHDLPEFYTGTVEENVLIDVKLK